MKAIYIRHTQESLLEDLGDDNISFNVFFKTENQGECRIPIILSYDDLHFWLKKTDEEIYKYLQKIRSNIHGYGPKHSKIFEVLTEEHFDLQPYIIKYIENLDDDFIDAHLEWVERISTPENREKSKQAVIEIKKGLPSDYAAYNIKFDQFKDDIDQTLHELTVKYFPELFEKDEEIFNKYKHLLISTTLDFSSGIDKLEFISRLKS